jgi:hypothetical protein
MSKLSDYLQEGGRPIVDHAGKRATSGDAGGIRHADVAL